MLHFLFDWLYGLSPHFSLFAYLSTKVIMAALTSLLIGIFFGPVFIRFMIKHQLNQNIRSDGPQRHVLEKQKTPTMGGVIILFALGVSVLLWADLSNVFIWVVLFVLFFFGAIGFADDYLKVFRKSPYGLRAWQKYLLQSVCALLVSVFIFYATPLQNHAYLLLPFVKDVYVPLGPLAVLLSYFVIVGSSNAVNLTDGLDGLAVMPVILVVGALSLMAYVSGHSFFSDYLYIPYIPLAAELVVVGAALFGSGLSFLWFNAYPAQVFMGDLGSLSLGALMGVMSVLVRQELVFALMSVVFVAEVVSVVLQVGSFKLRGKRIFKMAPFHHHLELLGWSEPKIIVRFWIVTLIFVLVGLASLKIR